MQLVILVAGRGLRMGELTDELPKPLLKKQGKTLLEHKFDSLPEKIDEVILVIGYKGNLIKEKYGNSYKNIRLKYIEGPTNEGTAKALWAARDMLNEKFLVCMGDDIYEKEAFSQCIQKIPSLACVKADREITGSRAVFNSKGGLVEFLTHKAYIEKFTDGGWIFTGLYGLTKDVFNYELVKLETRDEWGLPQTIINYAKDHPFNIVETNNWISITTPEDLD